MVDFVEICNVCTRKAIIKAAKRIFNSDKICRTYSDLNFGVSLFWNTVYCIRYIVGKAQVVGDLSVQVNSSVCVPQGHLHHWLPREGCRGMGEVAPLSHSLSLIGNRIRTFDW